MKQSPTEETLTSIQTVAKDTNKKNNLEEFALINMNKN